MEKARCIELTQEVVAQANKIFNISLVIGKVEFFHKGTNAGVAYLGEWKIAYNAVILQNETEESFMKTIVHEVSHFVMMYKYPRAKQAHGPEFKSVMQRLGVDNPSRGHHYAIDGLNLVRKNTVKRHVYGCNCGLDLKVTQKVHDNIVRGCSYSCSICKTKLETKRYKGMVTINGECK